MPPRTRSAASRGLPENLYAVQRRGRTYYQYRHPVTGKCHGFGYDRAAAIADARAINAHLADAPARAARVIGTAPAGCTLAEYVARYESEVLPARRIKGKPLSPAYLRETRRILARITDALGRYRMDRITQAQLAAYLSGIQSADAHNQHRVRLIQLWRHAMSDEVVTANVPERILPRDREARKRERLTLSQYAAIYAHARPAIRNAMELSLNALQRRTDVHRWRFDWQRDGHAHVIQSKTRKHGPSAWLRIPLAMPVAHSEAGARTLADVLAACRDDVACPFVIHERPRRLRKPLPAGKDHPFQLTAPHISRGFADARDAAGVCDHLTPEARPTFHELLSLGQHLREQQGWARAHIRALRGHTSEAMTAHYQEGHTWTTVQIPGAGT